MFAKYCRIYNVALEGVGMDFPAAGAYFFCLIKS